MAMRMLISGKEKSDVLDKSENLQINDFSLVGFKRDLSNSMANKKEVINFFWIIKDSEDNSYLIKNCFLIDLAEIEDEFQYFYHPLHIGLDLDIPEKKELVSKVISNFNGSMSFVCDFEPIKISNDNVSCIAVHYTLDNMIMGKILNIPVNIYMRIAMVINSIVSKYPINISIDSDSSYNDLKIHFPISARFLGSEIVNKNNLVLYFSLRTPNGKATGLAIPVADNVNGKIIIGANLTYDQFLSMYGENYFIANMKNLLVVKWGIDKDLNQRICLHRDSNRHHEIFILDEDVAESSILGYSKFIYPEV